MTRYLLEVALLVLAAVFAWRRGAAPERATAAALILMFVLDPLYHWLIAGGGHYGQVDLGHLTIDMITLTTTGWIALKADRWWTLWVSSAQVIAVLGHFLRLISFQIDPLVYSVMIRVPSYLQIALLLMGTWLHARRTMRIDSLSPLPRSSLLF
ncbi:hypothetical protein ACFFF7_09740 [Novosphingobium aquiterrae]|uniref:Rod shape-determining protein MreD n=1 Tax=Novosphingobium aquiterrae TaxID=624388 RepID=A0ABV6PIP9_9SPHN